MLIEKRLAKEWKERGWTVDISQVGDHISVRPHHGCSRVRGYTIYVSAPNWLERKLGITFQIKVQDAIKDVQALCDRWNAQEAKAAVQYQIATEGDDLFCE